MSLGFSFRAKTDSVSMFQQALDKLTATYGYHVMHYDTSSVVNFCKLGDLVFYYEPQEGDDNVVVNGDCQTNLLGAGFHKAAIEFVDELQAATDVPFTVEDETGYYSERDFDSLKNSHFHKWLKKILEVINEQEEKGSTALSICWDINLYLPKCGKGVIISPFGPFLLSDVDKKVTDEGIDSFANDFFIWNNPEQDAHFHRGLALHSLWEECYFMPSQRSEADAQINGYIINELEKAASLDPSLPFPKKEYELLCQLHGCTPISTDGMPSYESKFTIGYRRNQVTYKIGSIKFSLHGSFLKDVDDDATIYYDNADIDWHTVRCSAYSMDGEPDYIDIKEELIAEGVFAGGKYRLYDLGMCQDSDDEDTYHVCSGHVICENQYTLFTFCAPKPEDTEKLSKEIMSSLTKDTQKNNDIKLTYRNMNDELRKQIDEWHEADQHQEIIDALEKISAAELDFETVGLLARAYNNVGDYAKAIKLLVSVREEGEDDALWNFRMGYAEYYQDRSREALQYFNKAAELDPEDEDTRFFIRQCNMEMPFTKRVDEFWNWFVKNETKLSDLLHPTSEAEADDFTEFVHEGTSLISENLYFNLGGDHEFTFSIEGWPDLFILYPYIISRMPESLKGKWKFFPFNQGTDHSFGFRMYGADIDTARIMVGVVYHEDKNRFSLTYYENNLNSLSKEESDNAMWIILEHILGEGISFKYVNEIAPAEDIEDNMIALPGLKGRMEEYVKAGGKEFFENPKDLYSGYSMTPRESEELRFDVIVGSTCLDAVVADYYNDSTEIFDHANSFGAQAMFIVFGNVDCHDGRTALDFRHELEDRISAEILEPMNLGQVTGGATGTECCYIDLMIFNVQAFVNIVRPLLAQYPTHSFYISDFRRHAGISQLTEAETSPDDKENKE